jgi:hypothetical protein
MSRQFGIALKRQICIISLEPQQAIMPSACLVLQVGDNRLSASQAMKALPRRLLRSLRGGPAAGFGHTPDPENPSFQQP